MNDIDLSELTDNNSMWGTDNSSGAGFMPIGDNATPYSGFFDGQGFTISSLLINRPAENNVGLFGTTGAGSLIVDIRLEKGRVIGHTNTGGLTGINHAGGTIARCASEINVTGIENVGGLVGDNNFGTVFDCYRAGSVEGDNSVGGLLGINQGGTVQNCFWDNETAGPPTGTGEGDATEIVGYPTDLMQQKNIYVSKGWDFINTWGITCDRSYPFFRFAGNTAPLAKDDAFSIKQGEDLQVASPGLLSNDSDDDCDNMTAVLVDDPSNGTLVLNSDGAFSYTPDVSFTGTDSFSYKASDGFDNSPGNATVSITVSEDASSGGSGSSNARILTVAVSGRGRIISTSTPGINCPDECTMQTGLNALITLMAEPSNGQQFDAWQGCDEVEGDICRVVMDTSKNIIANFDNNSLSPAPASDNQTECQDDADCYDDIFCNGQEICEGGRCLEGLESCNDNQVCLEDEQECLNVEYFSAVSMQKKLMRPVLRNKRCFPLTIIIPGHSGFNPSESIISLEGPTEDSTGLSLNENRNARKGLGRTIKVPICLEKDADIGQWTLSIETIREESDQMILEIIEYGFEVGLRR